jgi:hypothetical protein
MEKKWRFSQNEFKRLEVPDKINHLIIVNNEIIKLKKSLNSYVWLRFLDNANNQEVDDGIELKDLSYSFKMMEMQNEEVMFEVNLANDLMNIKGKRFWTLIELKKNLGKIYFWK